MTRREADNRYVYYLQNNLNRLKKKESVIKGVLLVGVYDLDKIRNEMLIMDFPRENRALLGWNVASYTCYEKAKINIKLAQTKSLF